MKQFLVVFITLLALHVSLKSFAQNSDEQAIKQMLTQQVDDWNKGDLVSFMKGYWKNDSLMFLSKKGPTYGYASTLALYQKGYGDTARMGKFTSIIIKMERLSAECYLVAGRYDLKRSVGDASGHYSLLIRKIKGKWLIVVDHSS